MRVSFLKLGGRAILCPNLYFGFLKFYDVSCEITKGARILALRGEEIIGAKWDSSDPPPDRTALVAFPDLIYKLSACAVSLFIYEPMTQYLADPPKF